MSSSRSKGPPRQQSHEESSGESAPLWVISFADLSTLLMSFFVLMMASVPKGQTSQSPDAELLKILASIKLAFRYVPNPDSKDPLDLEILRVMSRADVEGGGKLWKPLGGLKGNSPPISALWDKAAGNVGEPVYFEPHSSRINSQGEELIDTVAELVRDHYRIIIIRGHVSGDEAVDEPDDGFDLAYERARAIQTALVERGIAPNRFRILSCAGAESPIGPSEPGMDPSARQRRAEITLGGQFLPAGSVPLESGLHPNEHAHAH